MKYIPAEKLIAEIRIIHQLLEHRDVRLNQVKKIRTECMIEFCKCILDVVTSLQQEQPEVDLDSALTGFMGRYAYENGGEYPSAIDIARHFYELGLNARKDE